MDFGENPDPDPDSVMVTKIEKFHNFNMGQISKIHISLKTYRIQFIFAGWIKSLVPYNLTLVNQDRIRISEIIRIFQNYPISPSKFIQFSSYLVGGYRV